MAIGTITLIGNMPGWTASADLSAKQYYLVATSAATTVTVAGAGAFAIGVLLNEPESGEACDVIGYGAAKVVSDGSGTAIAIGDPLKSDADGKAVKADTDKDHVIGYALKASAADGDIIPIILAPSTLSIA